jgi:acyl-CoA synthetase (AMP-forming)/AMP-acid ligase II
MIDPGMGIKSMVGALGDSGATALIGESRANLLRFLYPAPFSKIRIWINTGKASVPGSIRYGSLRITGREFKEDARLDQAGIAGIFFTSGSTGTPKGVIYTAGNMDSQVRLMKEHFNYGPEDIDLCTFPLLGLFVICLGSSVVIADMDPVRPARLNPWKIIRNINEYHCTQMFGSPMILRKLTRHAVSHPYQLPSLRRVISAGAPVPGRLIIDFLNLCPSGAIIHTPFGSTEALPVSDITSAELLAGVKQTDDYRGGICVGSPLKGVEIRIIRITDSEIPFWSDNICCAVDEVGEIVVTGPHITGKYLFKRANRLSKVSDRDRNITWHRMGDLGRIDKEGRLWFYGRKSHRVELDDRILFTIPTEAIFNKNPLVRRSALVGVMKAGKVIPVICIEPEGRLSKRGLNLLKMELLNAAASDLSIGIENILFHHDFPVDPRHNAKIFREKLAVWAGRRLK